MKLGQGAEFGEFVSVRVCKCELWKGPHHAGKRLNCPFYKLAMFTFSQLANSLTPNSSLHPQKCYGDWPSVIQSLSKVTHRSAISCSWWLLTKTVHVESLFWHLHGCWPCNLDDEKILKRTGFWQLCNTCWKAPLVFCMACPCHTFESVATFNMHGTAIPLSYRQAAVYAVPQNHKGTLP